MGNRNIALEMTNAIIKNFISDDNTTPEGCKQLAEAVEKAYNEVYPKDAQFFKDGIQEQAIAMLDDVFDTLKEAVNAAR